MLYELAGNIAALGFVMCLLCFCALVCVAWGLRGGYKSNPGPGDVGSVSVSIPRPYLSSKLEN